MPNAVYRAVFRQANHLFGCGTSAGMDEGLLLERFVSGRDEAAFEALVDRFGPMVLGVCRRRLDGAHDVEHAACAEDGDFVAAVKWQEKALDDSRRRRSA